MATFLAIETATDVCSVAVLKENQVVIEMALNKPRAHSENLVPMIKEALSYAHVPAHALAGIVVSRGPGSYTGLRIGVSAAKGLAYAHGIDLIGIPSLTSLATAALPYAVPGDTIAAAFNSRRNEVYLGLYTITDTGLPEEITGTASLHLDEIPGYMKEHGVHKLLIVGEGGNRVAESLEKDTSFTSKVLPANLVFPSAGVLATLGAARHKSGDTDDLENFEPFYLNEFIPKPRKKTIFDRLPF